MYKAGFVASLDYYSYLLLNRKTPSHELFF